VDFTSEKVSPSNSPGNRQFDTTLLYSCLIQPGREITKLAVRRAFNAFGLNVTRHRPQAGRFGADAMVDIRKLLADVPQPTVFDVGANVGQSAKRFSELLPGCELHVFEPSPTAFTQLQLNTRQIRNLHLCNAGVGAESGTQLLIENTHSDMSSFFRPGNAGWGKVVGETSVPVITLDDYCIRAHVERIDLLKVDTQGSELEVFKGATSLLAQQKIRLAYLEIIFSELYEGLPRFEDLYAFVSQHGLRLVAFYNFVVQDGVAGWCDALFRS
jgi:FkbM family methyltransferase